MTEAKKDKKEFAEEKETVAAFMASMNAAMSWAELARLASAMSTYMQNLADSPALANKLAAALSKTEARMEVLENEQVRNGVEINREIYGTGPIEEKAEEKAAKEGDLSPEDKKISVIEETLKSVREAAQIAAEEMGGKDIKDTGYAPVLDRLEQEKKKHESRKKSKERVEGLTALRDAMAQGQEMNEEDKEKMKEKAKDLGLAVKVGDNGELTLDKEAQRIIEKIAPAEEIETKREERKAKDDRDDLMESLSDIGGLSSMFGDDDDEYEVETPAAKAPESKKPEVEASTNKAPKGKEVIQESEVGVEVGEKGELTLDKETQRVIKKMAPAEEIAAKREERKEKQGRDYLMESLSATGGLSSLFGDDDEYELETPAAKAPESKKPEVEVSTNKAPKGKAAKQEREAEAATSAKGAKVKNVVDYTKVPEGVREIAPVMVREYSYSPVPAGRSRAEGVRQKRAKKAKQSAISM